MNSVCVIIPFFQRETGALTRALRSIQAQQGTEPISVLVIDDSSPVPAAKEVAGAESIDRLHLQVIRRPNGGPAAARNTGLNSLPTGTRYVAFLDSDDEWAPTHLESALAALSAGHDVFFANHYQLGQTTPAFERAGRLKYTEHPVIGNRPDLHSYVGDMFDQIMRGNVVGTSTVLYDVLRFPDIRFREEFSSAGEDYLFWMTLAHRGARFAFSTAVHATYGRGVNVYSGAPWGTPQHLKRVQNELRYRRTTARIFPVTTDQRRFLKSKIDDLRRDFLSDAVHITRSGKGVPWRACWTQAMEDPWAFLKAPYLVLRRRLTKQP